MLNYFVKRRELKYSANYTKHKKEKIVSDKCYQKRKCSSGYFSVSYVNNCESLEVELALFP